MHELRKHDCFDSWWMAKPLVAVSALNDDKLTLKCGKKVISATFMFNYFNIYCQAQQSIEGKDI